MGLVIWVRVRNAHTVRWRSRSDGRIQYPRQGLTRSVKGVTHPLDSKAERRGDAAIVGSIAKSPIVIAGGDSQYRCTIAMQKLPFAPMRTD